MKKNLLLLLNEQVNPNYKINAILESMNNIDPLIYSYANNLAHIQDPEERLNQAISLWKEYLLSHADVAIDEFYQQIEFALVAIYTTTQQFAQAKTISVRYSKLNPLTIYLLNQLGEKVDSGFTF